MVFYVSNRDVNVRLERLEVKASHTATRYDPLTGNFRPTGSLSQARHKHDATALADGRVMAGHHP